MKTDPESFIRANTGIIAPPHVPEIRLHLASEAHDLWLKTEEELEEIGLPPFWAFAWAGGQG
ncbi:MAG TPA: methyltransferase, partial [Sinorhizobium sp.]|nr:methyltransferase [Sinorhizobium sp.]